MLSRCDLTFTTCTAGTAAPGWLFDPAGEDWPVLPHELHTTGKMNNIEKTFNWLIGSPGRNRRDSLGAALSSGSRDHLHRARPSGCWRVPGPPRKHRAG